jgi:hypothetical protein
MRNAIVLILLVLCVAACGDKDRVPREILSKDSMAAVLLDMNLAEAYGRNMMNTATNRPDTGRVADSLREIRVKTLYAQVLQLHHLSVEEFMKSYQFYESHADRMEDVYKIMSDTANARNNAIETRRRAEETPKIWEKWFPRRAYSRTPFIDGH